MQLYIIYIYIQLHYGTFLGRIAEWQNGRIAEYYAILLFFYSAKECTKVQLYIHIYIYEQIMKLMYKD